MRISIYESKAELGKQAARKGALLISEAIENKGHANIIVATGSSQFEMLEELVALNVDWTKVTGFHLDEYIAMPMSHPASFRAYLKKRFVDRVNLKAFHYINAESDPETECVRLGSLITQDSIDVAFIGIGENAHLAFNDPPADFETQEPYLVVNLDEVCRKQQFGEGWFKSIDEVPHKAVSMSVRQIMKSDSILCSVSEERKSEAVRKSIEEGVSPDVPASVLSTHARTWIYLDRSASSRLRKL